MLEHILNWELKKGSHEFPGPDGGTCVTEAAVVAAGFEYKKINSAADAPACFSLPITTYAIYINDLMPDGIRKELLLPFVTRLAGTADDVDTELRRAEFIVTETSNRIISFIRRPSTYCKLTLHKDGPGPYNYHVLALQSAGKSLQGLELFRGYSTVKVQPAADITMRLAADITMGEAARVMFYVAGALHFQEGRDWREPMRIATDILSEAIMLGKHQPIDGALAATRMRELRLARAPLAPCELA